MCERPAWLEDTVTTHVGFITDSFLDDGVLFEGGAERHLYRLASLVQRLGAVVTVYQGGSVEGDLELQGLRVVRERAEGRLMGRKLARRALADGCSHVHFQSLGQVPYGASAATVTASCHAVSWDIPYVPGYRSWYPSRFVNQATLPLWRRRHKARSLRGVARCRAVLSVDSSLLRIVQSDSPELRDRIEVVLNFADLDPAASVPLNVDMLRPLQQMRVANDRDRTVVLVPRNLSLVRGGAWLVEIVQRVLEEHDADCEFFFTGIPVPVYGRADRYRRNLNSGLDRAPSRVQDRIHLLGGVPRPLMAAAFQLADLVLIPTFATEGSSLAALEAMAYGKAVVATNVGGLNDIIADDWTGLLARAEVGSIAAAVARLAADPTLRSRLGAEAQKQARARFTLGAWEERAQQFAVRAGWLRGRP